MTHWVRDIRGNWKLYAENTRDPCHASLLHLFPNSFGLYRSSQTGVCLLDPAHFHAMLYAKANTSNADSASGSITVDWLVRSVKRTCGLNLRK